MNDRVEFVVQFMLTGRGDLRRMVRGLAEGWPQEPALDILHCIGMACGHLERSFAGEASVRAATEGWRMATLVGVDLAMMRRLGLPHDTSADLLAYWKNHDRFFLG